MSHKTVMVTCHFWDLSNPRFAPCVRSWAWISTPRPPRSSRWPPNPAEAPRPLA